MRKLPPLKALRAFEAAGRHMSFKAAADELGLTPTAISHQIRLLEAVLGRALFRRRPRPLTLTPAGVALFPVARSSFDSIAEAIATVRREDVSQRLRVATTAGSSLDGELLGEEVNVPQRLEAIAAPGRQLPSAVPHLGSSPPRLS